MDGQVRSRGIEGDVLVGAGGLGVTIAIGPEVFAGGVEPIGVFIVEEDAIGAAGAIGGDWQAGNVWLTVSAAIEDSGQGVGIGGARDMRVLVAAVGRSVGLATGVGILGGCLADAVVQGIEGEVLGMGCRQGGEVGGGCRPDCSGSRSRGRD